MAQWFRAWVPANVNEVCFVFEDDIEVSPQYYRHAYASIEKYYCDNSATNRGDGHLSNMQLQAHFAMLQAVRAEGNSTVAMVSPAIEDFMKYPSRYGINSHLNVNITGLEDYARLYAGYPIIYGVCLQNQHLDPVRYSRKLETRHANQNYLYRYIYLIYVKQFHLIIQFTSIIV